MKVTIPRFKIVMTGFPRWYEVWEWDDDGGYKHISTFRGAEEASGFIRALTKDRLQEQIKELIDEASTYCCPDTITELEELEERLDEPDASLEKAQEDIETIKCYLEEAKTTCPECSGEGWVGYDYLICSRCNGSGSR